LAEAFIELSDKESYMNPTATTHIVYPNGCPACQHTQVALQEVEDAFDYGTGAEKISVVASIPQYTCENCGLSFSDSVAEERRHDAVCNALGVLAPREVRAIRELGGLSQAEFASLSGLGKASLGRWERGALIQNEANDNLLRLLGFPENVARLRSIREPKIVSNVIPFARKFGCLASVGDEKRLRTKAANFSLYG
jgi:putative zinc finger/helix-turn-helix YgiT family protein